MKYVMLFPNNLNRIFNSLVEQSRNPVKHFLIDIYKLSSAILRLSYILWSATTCKLILLHVRGIGNFKKRKMIFTWYRKQKSDFIFLQETHSKKDSETCWKNEWGSEIIMVHGSSNSRRVAILVKKGVDCTIHSKILDPLGRHVILKAEINNKMLVLINVYATNKDTNIINFLNNLLITL